MAVEAARLQVPVSVVTKHDVGQLVRETESVASYLDQAAIREPGTPQTQLPRLSRLMNEMVATNNLNLLQSNDRLALQGFLQALYRQAPVLHVSFNNDPSSIFTQKLITWIRQNMHPYVLLQIGLHPNIGAGCIVRTTNKFFDFSLREHFLEKRGLLIEALRGQTPVNPDKTDTSGATAEPDQPPTADNQTVKIPVTEEVSGG